MDKTIDLNKQKKKKKNRKNKQMRKRLLRKKHKLLEKQRASVPPPVKLHLLSTLSDALRSQMRSSLTMVKNRTGVLSDSDLVSEFQMLKLSRPELYASSLSSMRKFAHYLFGVWQPIIVLKVANETYGGLLVGSDGSAVFINSLAINTGQLASIALLWAIFDEYRPVGPFKVYYSPFETAPTKCWGIGVIDYSDNSTLFSVEEALTYDTAQVFDVMPHKVTDSGVAEWRGHAIGIPDRQWVTTGSTAIVAHWKSYSYNKASAAWTASFIYGSLGFKMALEFRQLNQGG